MRWGSHSQACYIVKDDLELLITLYIVGAKTIGTHHQNHFTQCLGSNLGIFISERALYTLSYTPSTGQVNL